MDAVSDHRRRRRCPGATIGAALSIRIAVKGAPSPVAAIPEAESVAVASRTTERFVQPRAP